MKLLVLFVFALSACAEPAPLHVQTVQEQQAQEESRFFAALDAAIARHDSSAALNAGIGLCIYNCDRSLRRAYEASDMPTLMMDIVVENCTGTDSTACRKNLDRYLAPSVTVPSPYHEQLLGFRCALGGAGREEACATAEALIGKIITGRLALSVSRASCLELRSLKSCRKAVELSATPMPDIEFQECSLGLKEVCAALKTKSAENAKLDEYGYCFAHKKKCFLSKPMQRPLLCQDKYLPACVAVSRGTEGPDQFASVRSIKRACASAKPPPPTSPDAWPEGFDCQKITVAADAQLERAREDCRAVVTKWAGLQRCNLSYEKHEIHYYESNGVGPREVVTPYGGPQRESCGPPLPSEVEQHNRTCDQSGFFYAPGDRPCSALPSDSGAGLWCRRP